MSALLQMQGCCPRRDSPSSPREIAAGILGTKSFPEMVLRFRTRNTGRPCKLFVCDRDCFAQKLYRARLPCVLLFTIAGFWVGGLVAYGGGSFEESSSPLKCTGQCGTIHTVALRASEARSLAPGLSVGRHDDRDTLIQGLVYQRAQWMREKRVTRKPRTVPDPNNQAKR